MPLITWFQDAVHDVRFAVRTFRRSPLVTATVIATLALGIGANTTVFTLADAVLLRMLPVPQPEQLIQILQPTVPPRPPGSSPQSEYLDRFSFNAYQEMQQVSMADADLLAESPPYVSFATIDGTQETIRYSAVSGNYFKVLGLRPVRGRFLDSAVDNEPGRHPEAVISYGFWQRRFAMDSMVIGSAVYLNGIPFEIIGIAEQGFTGMQVGSMTDIWIPANMEKRDLRRSTFLRLIARLRLHESVPDFLAPLQVWYRQTLLTEFEKVPPSSNAAAFSMSARLHVLPAAAGMSPLREQYGEPIRIVFATVAAILLLACANIANLFLARASARQREMAVRKSVGASRLRLVRQLLTESLVLTLAAGAAALLLARWAAPVLVSMLAPSDNPVQLDLAPNFQVLAFVCAMSIVTAVGTGILPALFASETDIHPALKGTAGTAGRRRVWQSTSLVALQMALSLMLLIVSALFVRTLINLKTLDPGFDRHNVILATVSYRGPEEDGQLVASWLELLRRISDISGVESASTSVGGPLLRARRAAIVQIADASPDESNPSSWFIPTSADYFRTFGRALIKGRDFVPRDFEPTAPAVAIINQTLARRYFGDSDPIGKRLRDSAPNLKDDTKPHTGTIEVIGVAPDMKFDSLRTMPPPVVYLPLTQNGSRMKLGFGVMGLAVRTRQDSQFLLPTLRRELAATSPKFTLLNTTTQSKLVDDSLLRERLLATVGSFFGVVALMLAAIGLYGTISYSVSRRKKEIGIRMALGARQERILMMVFREALMMAVVGIALGIGLSTAAARIIASFLFGVAVQDPHTIAASVGVLAAISLLAALAPALRACKAIPLDALRSE